MKKSELRGIVNLVGMKEGKRIMEMIEKTVERMREIERTITAIYKPYILRFRIDIKTYRF